MPADKQNAGWYRWDGDDLLLNLRVQPRAKRNELADTIGGHIKIRIAAPPVDGKANAHLCRFLAKLFCIPVSGVELIGGAQNRLKRVRIRAPKRLPENIAHP